MLIFCCSFGAGFVGFICTYAGFLLQFWYYFLLVLCCINVGFLLQFLLEEIKKQQSRKEKRFL